MPSSGETYRVAAYECDQNSVLQLATVFNWLQDAMDRYSQKHKIGHDFCQKNNITYMLKGYDVLIDSLPKWMDSVAISTDLVNAARCSLFFKQTMSDMHTQKTLLSSVSHVVLIDLLNRRPIRVNGNLPPEALEVSPMEVNSLSLPPLDVIHEERVQEITPDCIDFNQHVNNTNYIVFAERSLNQALYKKERLKRIQIAYKQAAVLGDEISVSTKLTSDLTDHQLSSSSDPGKSFARVRFFWNSKSK